MFSRKLISIAMGLAAAFTATAQTLPEALRARPLKGEAAKALSAPRAASSAQRLLTTTDGTEIWGSLISSNAWTDNDQPAGMYSFGSNASSTAIEALKVADHLIVNGGYGYKNNYLYYVSYSFDGYTVQSNYYAVSMDDWKSVYTEPVEDVGMIALDADTDPTTNLSYGCFYNSEGSSFEFAKMNYATFEKTTIATLQKGLVAVAMDITGKVYAINTDGALVTVDKMNGEVTVIGSTGVSPKYLQSAAFDRTTGKLYWAATLSSGQSNLYEVNTTTGKATLLKHFPNDEEFTALYIPTPPAGGAPAEVENLAAIFPNGSYDGTISFNAPTKSVDGSALTGELDYYIVVHRDSIRTGKVMPGGEVKETFGFNDFVFGDATFTVLTGNSAGKSKKKNVSLYIGPDEPIAPQNVVLTYDEASQTMTLTWDAVNIGTHGGYVDPATTTYEVVRYPGAKTVAEKLSATTFSESIASDDLTQYYYTVCATYNYKTGALSTSNAVLAGKAYDVPYLETFDYETSFYLFHVDDVNADNSTWAYDAHDRAARYNYHHTNAGDDWLISPSINLVAGKQYRLAFKAYAGMYSGNSLYPERFEVAMGKGNDGSAMTTPLIGKTDLRTETPTEYRKTFTVDADGTYNFGFHAISDANMYRLLVDSISVTEAADKACPDEPTELTVTPAADGSLKATISFLTPAKTIGGTPITSVSKVSIYRNAEAEPIKTFGTTAASTRLTYTDEALTQNGNVTYRVQAANEAGEGLEAEATVFVGFDVPLAPDNVLLRDNNGSLSLSWSAVVNGVNGGNVGSIEYIIYQMDQEGNATQVGTTTETTFSPTIEAVTEQQFVYYRVSARTTAGEGETERSNGVLVGDPYYLPFEESVPQGGLTTVQWYTEQSGSSAFELTTEASADNDGGAFRCVIRTAGDDASVCSPKITLVGATQPKLIFQYYFAPGMEAKIKPIVNLATQSKAETTTIDLATEAGEAGWRQATIDLTPYATAPYIIIELHATGSKSGEAVLIDDVRVVNMLQSNLAARTLSGQQSIYAGQPATFLAIISNLGEETVSDYTVSLFADGKEVTMVEGPAINSLEDKQISLSYTAPAASAGSEMAFYAKINCQDDLNDSDDTTEEIFVSVLESTLPTAENVTASGTEETVLTWDAPEIGDQLSVTDDFEAYTPWATSGFGEWLTYDGDGARNYRFNGITMPHEGEAFAYIVFNPAQLGISTATYPEFTPHSGKQYMVSMAASTYYAPSGNDDWLISPELSGKAQTISLYARSYYNDVEYVYPESFEICTSTGGTAASDFTTVVATNRDLPFEWTEYTADLPEGTKRFAIHCISVDKFALFVDDVTYSVAAPSIVGYNIYVDGKLVATLGADQTTWTSTASGEHKYEVSVVYDKGESAPVEANASTGISLTTAELASPQDVYTADGRLVRRNATTIKGLPRGIYVVGNLRMLVR